MDAEERSQLMELGIEHCRSERWEQGLECLAEAFGEGLPQDRRTAVASSYLGYALARKGRVQEGLRLCERAVRKEFFQPEPFLNLSRAYMLAGNRRDAVRVLEQGLALDAEHAALRALRAQLGHRDHEVLPFLSRSHPLNVWLGKLRHRMKK